MTRGYSREEPGAGKPHARICEGESRMAELLDHDPACSVRKAAQGTNLPTGDPPQASAVVQNAPRTGRDQMGKMSDIVTEYPGDFV